MNKNKPSSGSIISAIVFIVLLLVLGIYSMQKNNNGDENNSKEKTSYNLKSKDSITIGKTDSKVTFLEFADYECPACRYFAQEFLPTIKKEYSTKIKFVFKQFPLDYHKQAKPTSRMAICAYDQGKYEQMNDILVKNYDNWTKNSKELEKYPKEISLDLQKFNQCINSKQVDEVIAKDMQNGIDRKITGTPTIFINDTEISLQETDTIEEFRQIIDSALAK